MIARAIERAVNATWKIYSTHILACPICARDDDQRHRYLCALGKQLRDNFIALQDLTREPSTWNQVRVEA